MALTTSFTFVGMNNVAESATVGAPDRSLYAQDRAYTQCVEIVNCDVDNTGNASRREGQTLQAAGAITSGWSNGTKAYCVSGGRIHRYLDGQLVQIGNSPSVRPTVEFCTVNDVVLFSDEYLIGLIDASDIYYPITAPSEAVDLLDLETWVKLAYPAGADSDESNLEIDAFKIATLAGCCLEFYNGAAYVALDNFIYCTKTFDVEHMDIRYNVVAGFKDKVTFVQGVSDGGTKGGLFVGTKGGVYFLSGTAGSVSSGFSQKKLLPFAAVYGSQVKVPADKVPALKTDGDAVIFLTSDGVYAGGAGGQYVDLTDDMLRIPAGDTAAAGIHVHKDSWLYRVSVGSEAVVVNLKSAAHSRYTNYAFNTLFTLATKEYGGRGDGLFLLEGSTDQGAAIDAYLTTPVADFGAPQLKRCTDAYLHARAAGEMSLSLWVDEIEVATDLPFVGPYNVDDGIRRFRAKLPRGARGTNWQFRVSNVDGADFTALNLKIIPVASDRTV